jgi:aminopeptidase N
MLGDPMFGNALHAFMDRWHGKHPIPWDFFNTVNNVTGQNLDWFWQNWFFNNGFIDVAVAGVTKSGDGYTVVIDNVGGMPAPVDVLASYGDGTSESFHQTSAIWRANPRRATVSIAARKPMQSLRLETGIWVDADSTNNRWTQR